jgi:hypothetical protein
LRRRDDGVESGEKPTLACGPRPRCAFACAARASVRARRASPRGRRRARGHENAEETGWQNLNSRVSGSRGVPCWRLGGRRGRFCAPQRDSVATRTARVVGRKFSNRHRSTFCVRIFSRMEEKIQSSTTLRFRPGTTLDVVDIYEELPFLGTEKRCAMECARAERDAARASGRHQRAPHAPASPRSRWRRARYPTRARPPGLSAFLASPRDASSRPARGREEFSSRARTPSRRDAPRRRDVRRATSSGGRFARARRRSRASRPRSSPRARPRSRRSRRARRTRSPRDATEHASSTTTRFRFFSTRALATTPPRRRHPSASRPSSKAKAPW